MKMRRFDYEKNEYVIEEIDLVKFDLWVKEYWDYILDYEERMIKREEGYYEDVYDYMMMGVVGLEEKLKMMERGEDI